MPRLIAGAIVGGILATFTGFALASIKLPYTFVSWFSYEPSDALVWLLGGTVVGAALTFIFVRR